MDLFLSVHLQKQYLLVTLLIDLLILFKWTLLERSLRILLRSLVIKSLTDNIFIERLGFKVHSNFSPKENAFSEKKIFPKRKKNCLFSMQLFSAVAIMFSKKF